MYRRESMQGIYHKTGVSMVTQKGLLSFKIKKKFRVLKTVDEVNNSKACVASKYLTFLELLEYG